MPEKHTGIMSEKKGSDPKFIYSQEIIGYTVTVTDTGNGTLEFNQSSYDMTEAFTPCENCSGSGTDCTVCGGFGYTLNADWTVPDNSSVPLLTNGLADGSLSISKIISSDSESGYSSDQEFHFTVKLVGDKLEFQDNQIEYTINGSSEIVKAIITNGEFQITLKGGETAVFNAIPAGTVFQVTEHDLPEGWDLEKQENPSGVIESLKTSEAKFTNQYDPSQTTATIVGFKYLDGKPASENAFQFELYEIINQAENYIGQVNVQQGGFIEFKPIVYQEAGIYHYIVREVISNPDPNIEYDQHEEKITVTVTQDKNDTLHSSVKYESGNKNYLQFENTTKSGALELSKSAVGEYGDDSPDFWFTVNFKNENGIPISGENIDWKVLNSDGSEASHGTGSVLYENNSIESSVETPEAPDEISSNGRKIRINRNSFILTHADAEEVIIPAEEYQLPQDQAELDAFLAQAEPLKHKNGKTYFLQRSVMFTIYKTDRYIRLYDGQKVPEYILVLDHYTEKDVVSQGVVVPPGMLDSKSGRNPLWHDEIDNNMGIKRAQITAVVARNTIYTSYDYKNADHGNNDRQLFWGFNELVYADLRNLDAHNTIRKDAQMNDMFMNCTNLTTIRFGGKEKPFSAPTLQNMFSGCINFTTIEGLVVDFSQGVYTTWNHIPANRTDNFTGNLSSMFLNCKKLTSLDLSEWNFGNCTNVQIQDIFNGCENLTSLNFKGWNVKNVKNTTNMFTSCNSLQKVTFEPNFY